MSHRDSHRELEHRERTHHNGHVRREQAEDKLLNELAEHADEVLRLEAEAEEHRAAIRDLLPKARAADVKNGPAKLERVIKAVYARDTISRWTADVAPPRGKKAQEAGEA
jgi:hypothetical protein